MIKHLRHSSGRINIFIVEDHPVYRLGLKELLQQEEDMDVCGVAEDAETAWELIKKFSPDVIIVDLLLKNSHGIDLIKYIKKLNNITLVLVISMLDEMQYAERAFAAGASGYIMKHEASETIVDAIRIMLTGKRYMSENVTSALVDRALGSTTRKTTGVEALSDRELEIFRLIGSGYSTGRIALRMRLSVKTVGTYRERIKQKLGIDSSSSLVREAMRWTSEYSSKNGER